MEEQDTLAQEATSPLPAPATWVVGYDGSESARDALVWAAELAAPRNIRIIAASAWQYPYMGMLPLTGGGFSAIEPDMEEAISREVKEAAAKVAADTGARIEGRAVLGPAAQVLLDMSPDTAMTIVGSRGRGGFSRLLLGSVSHQMACHAERPTIIVPQNPGPAHLDKVIVGVDGSQSSLAALRWAAEFAPEADIVAVRSWDFRADMGAEQIDPNIVKGMRNRAERDLGNDVRTIVAERNEEPGRITPLFDTGHGGHRLVTHAADADLLVVGARGMTGLLGAVLGSVTTWVTHHLPCPTAVIPAIREEPGEADEQQ